MLAVVFFNRERDQMNGPSIHVRVLQVAGILVLGTLFLQFLIFEAAAVSGYSFWPLLVGFVAILIVVVPIAWNRGGED